MIEPLQGLTVRPRHTGDALRLPGGRKSLKKFLIDRKIPAGERALLPVIADRQGVIAVYGVGTNLDRLAHSGDDAMIIKIETEEKCRYD